MKSLIFIYLFVYFVCIYHFICSFKKSSKCFKNQDFIFLNQIPLQNGRIGFQVRVKVKDHPFMEYNSAIFILPPFSIGVNS